MKTTEQLFHRHLLVAIIAIIFTITPIQSQALSLTQAQRNLLVLLLINSYHPFREQSLNDMLIFNALQLPRFSSVSQYTSYYNQPGCGYSSLIGSQYLFFC